MIAAEDQAEAAGEREEGNAPVMKRPGFAPEILPNELAANDPANQTKEGGFPATRTNPIQEFHINYLPTQPVVVALPDSFTQSVVADPPAVL